MPGYNAPYMQFIHGHLKKRSHAHSGSQANNYLCRWRSFGKFECTLRHWEICCVKYTTFIMGKLEARLWKHFNRNTECNLLRQGGVRRKVRVQFNRFIDVLCKCENSSRISSCQYPMQRNAIEIIIIWADSSNRMNDIEGETFYRALHANVLCETRAHDVWKWNVNHLSLKQN